MFVRRTNGASPVMRMREDMDRLFNGFMGYLPEIPGIAALTRGTMPAINIWEDEANLFAEAELPGLTMNEVEVTILGNELTIKGQRKEQADEGVSFHRRERGAGEFSRVIRLPVEVDADKVQATLAEGVLTVTMPKAPNMMPRKIEVKG